MPFIATPTTHTISAWIVGMVITLGLALRLNFFLMLYQVCKLIAAATSCVQHAYAPSSANVHITHEWLFLHAALYQRRVKLFLCHVSVHISPWLLCGGGGLAIVRVPAFMLRIGIAPFTVLIEIIIHVLDKLIDFGAILFVFVANRMWRYLQISGRASTHFLLLFGVPFKPFNIANKEPDIP
jgi:hypothetical protein